MKKILVASIWIFSLLITVLYTYENPDKIDDLYKYQNGGRTIPMLVYSDDDHQVNPKPNEVLEKIQSLN